MNVLPGIDNQNSKAKALKLLDRLIETPRKTAAQARKTPFFEFPDGPENYHFPRGWKYAVGEWFNDRLGVRDGESTKNIKFEDLPEKEKLIREPDKDGKVKFTEKFKYQSSAFCFKK